MTSKEKAIEIYDNFYLLHQSATDENGVLFISALNKGLAKKCALISVDEILNMLIGDSVTVEYWNEVRQEIEKI
jgi:hypothetical protein